MAAPEHGTPVRTLSGVGHGAAGRWDGPLGLCSPPGPGHTDGEPQLGLRASCEAREAKSSGLKWLKEVLVKVKLASEPRPSQFQSPAFNPQGSPLQSHL